MFKKLRQSITTRKSSEPGSEANPCDSSVQYLNLSKPLLAPELQGLGIDSDKPIDLVQKDASSQEDANIEASTLSFRSQSALSESTTNSATTASSYPLGLNLVYGPPVPEADIIFIHGLGGSAWKTWAFTKKLEHFWPAWLAGEEGLTRCRIFSFGYDSNFRKKGNPSSILGFAKGLLLRMKAYADSDNPIGTKPLIFIAHSMGGLVIKKALIIGKNNDEYSLIMSKVHGIMFLSTPHGGSRDARLLNSLLSFGFSTSSKVYVAELEPGSTSLEDMSEQFQNICSPWHLISLYESRPTKPAPGLRKRLLVDENVGVLGYSSEWTSSLDADHRSICKYHSRLDPNYRYVVNLLRQLMDRIGTYKAHGPLKQSLVESDLTENLLAILGAQGEPNRDLNKHLRTALPESGQWLFDRRNFKEWLSYPGGQSVLLLTGLPGSGKSTLAAQVVHHVQLLHGIPSCQYHFFVDSQTASCSATACLQSIARQLASTNAAFAARLVRLHQETGFTCTSQKFSAVWKAIFENIILEMDFEQPLFWIIDGLDECDTPKLLLDHLVQLQAKACIKILVLSRPNSHLERLASSYHGLRTVNRISTEDTRVDIEKYVNRMAVEILPISQDIRQDLVERIITKAEGSFLWTKLALESLEDNWHTEADIMVALNNVPNGMQAMYEAMMESVSSQKEQHRSMALRILTWTTRAHRPLRLEELEAALNPEFKGLTSLADTLVQICGQFVRIDQGFVTLIHSTARQFLLLSTHDADTSMNHDNCHEYLAVVCLEYLSQRHWRQTLSRVEIPFASTKQDRLVSSYQQYPLLDYALKHWAYHVRLSPIDSTKLIDVMRCFCDEYMMTWIHAVALANNLHLVPVAARELKTWLRHSRNAQRVHMDPKHRSNLQTQARTPQLKSVEDWTVDLIRIATTFGSNLLQSPSSIYRHIPPFCPAKSIISRTNRGENAIITVKGLQIDEWNDKLVHLPLGRDEIGSKIRCTDTYFLTLEPMLGVVTVYFIDTCVEVRKLQHDEYVHLIETDKKGELAVTAGRFTFRIWNLDSGQLIHSVETPPHLNARCMRFGKSNDTLVIGYENSTVVSYSLVEDTEDVLLQCTDQNAKARCAGLMELSPDHQRIAIAFRGRPLFVWDVNGDSSQIPRTCVLSREKQLSLGGRGPFGFDDLRVFSSPERLRWSCDSSHLYILYQDTTLLLWNFLDDEQILLPETGAKELVLSPGGTHLLTSDNSGSISLWGIPRMNLLYRLQSDCFVRDLTFSLDGQYILDIRDSGYTVWAPDILAGQNLTDKGETPSSYDSSTCSEGVSEPIYARAESLGGQVTVLEADVEGRFFSCGRDDGSVCIHSMSDGGRLRKVSSHAPCETIVALKWSASRKYLASADLNARVIVKRLKLKEDGKWAVFPVFNASVDHGVTQLLFSPNETILLISTRHSDILLDLKKKEKVCQTSDNLVAIRKWLNHPAMPDKLICVESTQRQCYQWEDLIQNGFEQKAAPAMTPSTTAAEPLDVLSVTHTSNCRYILYETPPSRGNIKENLHHHDTNLNLIDLRTDPQGEGQSCVIDSLRTEVRWLLGCRDDRIVFIDHSNWICTCSITGELDSITRHFFLPRDWVSMATLELLVLTKLGTLLCERKGEVAIVQYVKGF